MNIYDKIDSFQQAVTGLRPFEGDMLRQIREYYRVGLTWSSNALEGNTLTLSETKVVLEDGLTIGGKPLREIYETVGHGEAYDFMFSLVGRRTFTEQDILTMHRMFYKNIDAENAGSYRKSQVIITGSNYPVTDFEKIPKEMNALLAWANTDRDKYHPVEFAAQLHKRFVFIHPFIDGNGRLSRLLMNTALLQDGYLPAIIAPVLRADYIALLEKAHRDDSPFTEFIAEREYESQKEILRLFHVPFPKQAPEIGMNLNQ